MLCEERLLAIPAHPQRRGLVRHHQRKEHLNSQQQRMKIPNQHRVVVQLDMIGRRIPAEGGKSKAVRLSIDGILAVFFKIIVIQKRGHELETPVFEYCLQPVIALSVVAHTESLMNELSGQYDDLISWAKLYESASIEAKKMIVNCPIKRVEVGRDYKLNIEFNFDLSQFFYGLDFSA